MLEYSHHSCYSKWFAKISISQQIETCVMHTGYVNYRTVGDSTEIVRRALLWQGLGCRCETSAHHLILVTRSVLVASSPSSQGVRSPTFRRSSCRRDRRDHHGRRRCTSSSELAVSFSWCVS
jgi:hypothetical protein